MGGEQHLFGVFRTLSHVSGLVSLQPPPRDGPWGRAGSRCAPVPARPSPPRPGFGIHPLFTTSVEPILLSLQINPLHESPEQLQTKRTDAWHASGEDV
jgi:hypothetical protein